MVKQKRIFLCLFLAAGVFASGCGWWGGSSSDTDSPNSRTASSTREAPRRGSGGGERRGGSSASRSVRGAEGANLFRLPMVDGQPVTVRSPAILFFFTSWCGYCKQVMPEFRRLAERAKNDGWRVYGIDVGEGPAKANQVIQEYQPNFPVLLDQQSMVARRYGLEGYPTFVVVDGEGQITYDGHELPTGF